jgi:radical SAM protein with 4Fe4S-binding SPASM domain
MINLNLDSLVLEITNVCNFKCTMCIKYTDYYKSYVKNVPKIMDINLFKKIIDQYKSLKNNKLGSVIPQFQGESLMHPQFFEFTDYLELNEIPFGFTTNGSLLTKETAEKLLTYKYFTSITFSIDAFSKELFEKIRINSNRDIIYSNIDYFISKTQQLNRTNFIGININVVDQVENRNEFNDILNYFIDKVFCVTISNVTDENVIPKQLNFDVDRISCTNPFSSMIVLTNGKVVACCRDSKYKINLGNLSNQSLEEVWFGEKYSKLRTIQENKQWSKNKICNNCFTWACSVPTKDPVLFNTGINSMTEKEGMFWKTFTKK